MASRPVPHPSREPGTHSTPCTPQVLSCSVDGHINVCPCLEVRRSDRVVSCFLATAWFLLAAVGSGWVWAAEAPGAPGRSSLQAAGLVTISFYLGKLPGGRAAHLDLSTFFSGHTPLQVLFGDSLLPTSLSSISPPCFACSVPLRLSLHFPAPSQSAAAIVTPPAQPSGDTVC